MGTGSGAPLGNKNAFKHGVYTKVAIECRAGIRKLVKLAAEFSKAGR